MKVGSGSNFGLEVRSFGFIFVLFGNCRNVGGFW